MKFTTFIILASIDFTISTPVDRDSVVKKALPQAVQSLVQGASSALAGIGTLVKDDMDTLPSPAAGVIQSSPAPIGNAALWQEAIKFDAAKTAPNGTNDMAIQKFYAQIEWVQSVENSSNGPPSNAVESAAWMSRALQSLQMYPTRFDQAQALDPANSIVEISPAPQQIIKSFGASGAWWPNFLKDFPTKQQKNLSQLLFSEDWLYLSGYRYNMGASGDKDNVTVSTPGRGVESFMKTDGTYDWTRDGPGMYYLRAAEATGASIAFFVNAAPSALTENQSPCGGTLGTSTIAQFVAYIETVLAFWSDHNITIDYISPMNEPDDSFQNCGQEGMAVPVESRPEVFQLLRSALTASNSAGAKAVKIMGDETSQIASMAMMNYGDWLPQTLSSSSIDAMSAHMYDWPDDATLANYAQLIKNYSHPNPPPPIKMTEVSTFKTAAGVHSPWGWTGPNIMKGNEWDPTINSALDMARFIWQWMTIVNAESWDWWTAVSNMLPCSPKTNAGCAKTYNDTAGYNDGLIYIDPEYATTKNYQFYLTKRFWVFRHFTKFIRPGSVRYDIPNGVLPYGTVAIASRGSNNVWNTIFINRNATAQTITMRLPATGMKILGVTQTTDAQDWGSVPLPKVAADNSVKVLLPARGVLSMQFTVSGPISTRNSEDDWSADERRDTKISTGGSVFRREP